MTVLEDPVHLSIKHPLQCIWCLWFKDTSALAQQRSGPAVVTSGKWKDSLQDIEAIRTVILLSSRESYSHCNLMA